MPDWACGNFSASTMILVINSSKPMPSFCSSSELDVPNAPFNNKLSWGKLSAITFKSSAVIFPLLEICLSCLTTRPNSSPVPPARAIAFPNEVNALRAILASVPTACKATLRQRHSLVPRDTSIFDWEKPI